MFHSSVSFTSHFGNLLTRHRGASFFQPNQSIFTFFDLNRQWQEGREVVGTFLVTPSYPPSMSSPPNYFPHRSSNCNEEREIDVAEDDSAPPPTRLDAQTRAHFNTYDAGPPQSVRSKCSFFFAHIKKRKKNLITLFPRHESCRNFDEACIFGGLWLTAS